MSGIRGGRATCTLLRLRCGVPPRQTHDCITTMRPSVINSGYAQDSGGPPVGTAPTVSQPGDEKRAWSAGHKKYTAHGRTVGASRAFSVRQVMTVRNGKTAAETDRSRGEARQRDFITAHSSIMVSFYEPRTTSHEPLFFHEPRVTRGDVVILSLLPRSGI